MAISSRAIRTWAAAMLALAGVAAVTKAFGKAPALTIETASLDLGPAIRGEVLHTAFRLRNRGDAVLKIDEIAPGCGCTKVSMSDSSVPAGQSATLEATVDTSNLREGHNVVTVTLHTNDPGRPIADLTMQFDVRSEFRLSSWTLEFGTVKQSERGIATVVVRRSSNEFVRFIAVNCTDPQVVPRLEFGADALVVAELAPGASRGWHIGHCVVETTSEHMPAVKIPFTAFIAEHFTLPPHGSRSTASWYPAP